MTKNYPLKEIKSIVKKLMSKIKNFAFKGLNFKRFLFYYGAELRGGPVRLFYLRGAKRGKKT